MMIFATASTFGGSLCHLGEVLFPLLLRRPKLRCHCRPKTPCRYVWLRSRLPAFLGSAIDGCPSFEMPLWKTRIFSAALSLVCARQGSQYSVSAFYSKKKTVLASAGTALPDITVVSSDNSAPDELLFHDTEQHIFAVSKKCPDAVKPCRDGGFYRR